MWSKTRVCTDSNHLILVWKVRLPRLPSSIVFKWDSAKCKPELMCITLSLDFHYLSTSNWIVHFTDALLHIVNFKRYAWTTELHEGSTHVNYLRMMMPVPNRYACHIVKLGLFRRPLIVMYLSSYPAATGHTWRSVIGQDAQWRERETPISKPMQAAPEIRLCLLLRRLMAKKGSLT